LATDEADKNIVRVNNPKGLERVRGVSEFEAVFELAGKAEKLDH
jgi:hypothetical protein